MTLFKKESVPSSERAKPLTASVSGNLLDIENVPNAAISSKILGDGFAISTDGGEVRSPADGRIRDISDMGHTVSLKCTDGLRLLLNIDNDSDSELALSVRKGDEIAAGSVLCTVGKAVVSVVVTNSERLTLFEVRGGEIRSGSTVAVYKLKPKM